MDTPYTSSIRPPILDGTNYGPWKLKMSMYIQSIESRAWQRVLDGWTPPMRDDDVPGPKPRAQWTADENTAAIYNAKALNAMFTSVDMNMFNLIGTCTCARDGRLKSLANEASVLGDPISNERLVSKVLRSVPKRFHTKVCAIDESKDTSIMGLDELISSLRTYEMEMEAEDDTKGKPIAFQEVKESDLEENSIALISKKFTDYLKVMKEKKDVKGAQPLKFPKLPISEKPQKPANTLGPRQRECKGYGHYAYECANRLRKGLNVSLSDDESEGEQEKAEQADLISFTALLESKKNFQINPLGVGSRVATSGRNTVQEYVCFVASNLDNFSDHEEQVVDAYTLEGIQKLYEELYCDWIKRNQLNTTLTKENTELKAAVARLEVLMSKKDLELGLLNSELERAKTTLDKFNFNSSKLDSLLIMGKNDKFGLGFKESVFETGETSKIPVFVKEGSDSLNHPSTVSKGKKPIVEKNVSVLPPVLSNTKRNTGRQESTAKKVWVQKSDVKSFVIYTSLESNTAGNWYFDSGSSRHMIGLKDHLMDYIEQNGGRVTYGGCAKGRIVGKGTLNVEGFPKLHNVLHVEGLNANLISISQLCDDDFHVKFEKNTCEVFDNANRCVMTDLKGKITEDDIEGLLEIPHEEHSIVPEVATPNTTLVPPETFMKKILKIMRKLRYPLKRTFQARYKIIIHHHRLLEMFMEHGKPELRTKLNTVNAMHEELEQFVQNDVWF
ncbi:uncharacterized protein [Henckelia pumila]|uniref:uncharacterized protein n=1 Tax=Henckelia pumila TaxID=405737 RepID=UPI003C6E6BA9